VLSYDPDTAGQGAAERSCELLVSEGFDVNVALLPAGQDPDTMIQKRGRDAYVAEIRRSKRYLEFLLDRAAAESDLTRDDGRRVFVNRMLAVAARIPDPTDRDHFADKLAHKARVTEEVIRAEIRKIAAARRTALPAERGPSPSGPLRDVERALLWAIVHTPEAAIEALGKLEEIDLEGLSARSLLLKAMELAMPGGAMLPSALMERLTDQESQLLSKVATERESPVHSLDSCVQVLRFSRVERQLLEIQQNIDRGRLENRSAEALDRLLRQKNELRTQLEYARRGPRDGYNK
jgi:DNA primase